MKKEDIINATKFIGSDERKNNLKRGSYPGGDPLMSIPLLSFTIDQIKRIPPI